MPAIDSGGCGRSGPGRRSGLVEQGFWSEEDEGYIADIPDLDSCSAFGRSPAEALAEVEQAKTAWLAAARAEGKPVPPPRYRPAIYKTA